MLGDQSGINHTVFRENGGREFVKTIAVGMLEIKMHLVTLADFNCLSIGIFDCKNRTWSLYSDNPKTHEPLVVIPMDIK